MADVTHCGILSPSRVPGCTDGGGGRSLHRQLPGTVHPQLTFHLLAELFRKIHHLEQRKSPAGLSSSIALLLNPCLAVLMALQTELRKLYDRETQGWASAGPGPASSGGVALALGAEQSRFSTYFHALDRKSTRLNSSH